MIRNGKFVAEHLEPTTFDSIEQENIQPNGVDLRVSDIKLIEGTAYLGSEDYTKPSRHELDPGYQASYTHAKHTLSSGSYAIIYDEKIEIPEGHVGRVYPRSRVMRSGGHLTSALWDQGYEGRGEGLLMVPPGIKMTVRLGKSLGQMIFEEADTVAEFEQYDGTHQGERLPADGS